MIVKVKIPNTLRKPSVDAEYCWGAHGMHAEVTILDISATLPFGLMIAEMGLEKAALKSEAVKLGINVYRGKCVYENVSKAFNIPYTRVDRFLH